MIFGKERRVLSFKYDEVMSEKCILKEKVLVKTVLIMFHNFTSEYNKINVRRMNKMPILFIFRGQIIVIMLEIFS